MVGRTVATFLRAIILADAEAQSGGVQHAWLISAALDARSVSAIGSAPLGAKMRLQVLLASIVLIMSAQRAHADPVSCTDSVDDDKCTDVATVDACCGDEIGPAGTCAVVAYGCGGPDGRPRGCSALHPHGFVTISCQGTSTCDVLFGDTRVCSEAGFSCQQPIPFDTLCNPAVADCAAEICGNGFDDDCDGKADCDDGDCKGWTVETCDGLVPGDDFDCDGDFDCDDSDCLDGGEICGDGADNDCLGAFGDDTNLQICRSPDEDIPNNHADDDEDGDRDEDGDTPQECNETCGCDGEPVSLLGRQAYIGPYDDVRLSSPQGGTFDLTFGRVWDSAAAQRDNADDVSSPNEPEFPQRRVLGPGWRHTLDTQLIVNFSTSIAGSSAINPVSILFDSIGHSVRLHKTSSGSWARSPTDAMSAVRFSLNGVPGWRVTTEDGTLLFFADNAAATESHPAGITTPAGLTDSYLRLTQVSPMGVSAAPTASQVGYRIRLYYEQDASAIPSQWCTNVVRNFNSSETAELTSCKSTRGLLVGAAQEWWDGTTWQRGDSIVFRYVAFRKNVTGKKLRIMIESVVDGTDVAASVAAARLADFSYTFPADLPWRPLLSAAATCADRTGTGGDSATCSGEQASQTRTFTQFSDAPAIASHLIAAVSGPVILPSGITSSKIDEQFDWQIGVTSGRYEISEHRSQGIELASTERSTMRNGIHSWTRNGVERRLEYFEGV